MAKFILDGQEYGGGSSGSNIVKLTQAEYDALSNDKLSNDTIYLITDSSNGELTAENLFYDGTETGLGNNVQSAIDELNSNMLPLSGGSLTGSLSIDGHLILNKITNIEEESAIRYGGIYGYIPSLNENIDLLRCVDDNSGGTNISLGIGDGFYKKEVGKTNICSGEGVSLRTSQEIINFTNVVNDANYSATFRPNTNGKCLLGSSNLTWHTVYAKTGTINTSDEREKENIIPMKENTIMTFDRDGSSQEVDIYSELFDRLEPVEYNFINNTDGRTCFGLVAQQVVSAMEEVGFEENDLDLVHHDYHTDEESGEEKDTYGINYNNLIALLIHEVQKLKAEVASLKAE